MGKPLAVGWIDLYHEGEVVKITGNRPVSRIDDRYSCEKCFKKYKPVRLAVRWQYQTNCAIELLPQTFPSKRA